MDILANLDNVLDKTPEHAFACPPLPRRTIAAAAAEIRTLRARLATANGGGKTRTVPEFVELMDGTKVTI